MNYFAHAHSFLHDPYLLAGAAVPDWLNVVDRRVRVRSRLARPFLQSKDQRIVALAAGILRHHQDDDWFHRTRAFAELSLHFTAEIRDLLPPDRGLRPSFLGHILVELLLDAALIEQQPERLALYYRSVERLDPELVSWAVRGMATRPIQGLEWWIPRFSRERFLYDYREDAKLLLRLNHIMHRVRLPSLPEKLCAWLPSARDRVRQRMHDLLGQAAS